jgi:predicted AlkP superfamily phosphohydrolase/phosphomutase
MNQTASDLGGLRLAVIGLDGADPDTLRRYIAEGRLPAIARLFGRSREVEIRTEGELFLNSSWPCFASGLSVGSHGIHAFRPLRSGTMQLVEGTDFRMPAPFWEVAARAGVATSVLDVPLYGPPSSTSGLEKLRYVEWAPHPPLRPQASAPVDLTPLLMGRHGPHPCTVDTETFLTLEESADMMGRLAVGARKRAGVIGDLIRTTKPELLVAVFSELHTAGHQWLHCETPDHRCYDAAMVSALGSPIRRVYEAVDAAIGELIEQLPPETTVLLTCLGGFRVTHGGGYLLYDLLVRLGLSVPAKDSLIEVPPGLPFDFSKTRAFALPWAYDGYMRINQHRREPCGIVAKGPEREQLLAQIETAVRALRVAGTDEPAARVVVRAQERFPGPASAELPDLMVLWNNSRPLEAIECESIGRIENRDPAARSSHSSQGFVFAHGPRIATGPMVRGSRDFDIAPTVLELLGIAIPGHVQGRAISELVAKQPIADRDRQRADEMPAHA